MEKTLSAHSPDPTAAAPPGTPPVAGPPRSRGVAVAIVLGGLAVMGAVGAFVQHSESQVNKVALASKPKPVTAVAAREATYRATHLYVGTLRPWVEANVGPQFVSAY